MPALAAFDQYLAQAPPTAAHRADAQATVATLRARVARLVIVTKPEGADITIDDPKAYTGPFTVRVLQRVVADGSEPIEFICHENQTFLKLTGRAPR